MQRTHARLREIRSAEYESLPRDRVCEVCFVAGPSVELRVRSTRMEFTCRDCWEDSR